MSALALLRGNATPGRAVTIEVKRGAARASGCEPNGRDCRQPRYPGRSLRGPEVLRPRLTAALPLSATGLSPALEAVVLPNRRRVLAVGRRIHNLRIRRATLHRGRSMCLQAMDLKSPITDQLIRF
jgi:hypothetical protein